MALLRKMCAVIGQRDLPPSSIGKAQPKLTSQGPAELGKPVRTIDQLLFLYPCPWGEGRIKSDPIADLTEDMAAEQKARVTYDNILRLAVDDPDVTDVIRFLRAREIVHFQRFGSALQLVREKLDHKNVYYTNPAFDR